MPSRNVIRRYKIMSCVILTCISIVKFQVCRMPSTTITQVSLGHGIIGSRRVWLTDYRFLNDKRELKQGYTHFIAALPENLRASFERAFLWHDQFNHHCVLSLSHSPKILSQWRAYADDATGLAFGFSEKFLNFAKIQLVPCQYESQESYALDFG